MSGGVMDELLMEELVKDAKMRLADSMVAVEMSERAVRKLSHDDTLWHYGVMEQCYTFLSQHILRKGLSADEHIKGGASED